jgi:hypothetical protein
VADTKSDDPEFAEYRKHLVLAEQKAQEDYDKTVLSLSGGALGISFAFIDKVVKTKPLVSPGYLFWSWVAWASSVVIVLASYFFSIRALRKAIKQSHTGEIYVRKPGGWAALLTETANIFGAAFFILGLFLLGVFVWRNISP